MEQVGHAALPYTVSVGRLHAFDVLPHVVLNETEAEREEGLRFAEAFGVGVSLHFKLGKLLLSLALAAAVLQAPMLVLYAHRGDLFFRGAHHHRPHYKQKGALRSAGFGGAVVVRYSMAAVEKTEDPAARAWDWSLAAFFASLATLTMLCGAAAARELVRRDVDAMKALAPRPEHYALLLRDVSPEATAADLLRDLRAELKKRGKKRCRIERVACHHALRPVLAKAVETMAAESSENVWRARARRYPRLFGGIAAYKKRRLDAISAELALLARSERPARAVAAFVVFDSPRSARDAAVVLAKRLARLSPPPPLVNDACGKILLSASASCCCVAMSRAAARTTGREPFPFGARGSSLSMDEIVDSWSALGYARASMAPSPVDIVWENLELDLKSRAARRLLVRCVTLLVCAVAMVAVLFLRGTAIDEQNFSTDDEAGTSYNATAAGDVLWKKKYSRSKNEQSLGYATTSVLAPYLTRERSPRRHALLLVGVVVLLNSILRFVVRRGSLFEAHSTRSTEQSAALISYFAATTLNTLACYALAAWRGAVRFERDGGRAMYWLWYADVGGYLVTTLAWESLAPPTGALLRALARRALGIPLERRRQSASSGESVASGSGNSASRRRRTSKTSSTNSSTEMTPLFHPSQEGGDEKKNPWTYLPWPSSIAESRRLDQPSPPSESLFRRLVAGPASRYLAAPPWDATSRAADLLRVYFVGAVFGSGQPLLPWLACLCIAAMLAHDKWALLRERRLPPRIGPHLARTAAGIAPFAAPVHACLALWTWSDPNYTGAKPLVSIALGLDRCYGIGGAGKKRQFWSALGRRLPRVFCVVSTATWPVFVALLFAVGSLVVVHAKCLLPKGRRRRRKNNRTSWPLAYQRARSSDESTLLSTALPRRSSATTDAEDEDDDVLDSSFFPDSNGSTVSVARARRVEGHFPSWRDAVTDFERKNIPHLYDVYDDARPLERERHPHFFHHWGHLSSHLAKDVLEVFTPPTGHSDSTNRVDDIGDESSGGGLDDEEDRDGDFGSPSISSRTHGSVEANLSSL